MSLEIGTDEEPQHFHDELGDNVGTRLNWLRAAVLGANDGIVSTAGVVMGVAGATDDSGAIVIAGIAALTAGALSMGAGEYVSVSTQRDSEKSILALEATELRQMPETRSASWRRCTSRRASRPPPRRRWRASSPSTTRCGRTPTSSSASTRQPHEPWHAAGASMVAFTVGALLPLLIVAFVPDSLRILLTVLSVAAALALTGFVSARIGLSPRMPAVLRNVAGGLLAMGVTYVIGMLAGTSLG